MVKRKIQYAIAMAIAASCTGLPMWALENNQIHSTLEAWSASGLLLIGAAAAIAATAA